VTTAPASDDASAAASAAARADARAPAAPAEPSGSAELGGAGPSGSGLFEASQAQSESGASSAPAANGVELNGYVRGDIYAGKVPNRGAGELKAAYGELALKFRVKKEKFGDAFAEARVRYGLQGDAMLSPVDLREAYVNLYAGPLDLRLGRQIVVWGRADALNPTSNITPVDLRVRSPLEDDRRVGNVGARAFLNFQPVRLEGVWMPMYAPSSLPIVLPNGVVFGPDHFQAPGSLAGGVEAGRVHLELPAIELSASYLYGYAPLPGLAYFGHYTAQPEPASVEISRVAYNQHVVGFDFATTLGDFLGVRGEAAYRKPLHYNHRPYAAKPDVQYVLGVDHTFDDVSVIAQYIGKYTVKWRPPPAPGYGVDYLETHAASPATDEAVAYGADSQLYLHNQQLFAQLARVQHLASLRVEWLLLHQTLSLSALGVVNFTTHEWLAFPKVAYQFSDNMTASVGADLFEGPVDTLFGSIKSRLSAAYAELRFAF
jgi:hypothetical protein